MTVIIDLAARRTAAQAAKPPVAAEVITLYRDADGRLASATTFSDNIAAVGYDLLTLAMWTLAQVAEEKGEPGDVPAFLMLALRSSRVTTKIDIDVTDRAWAERRMQQALEDMFPVGDEEPR